MNATQATHNALSNAIESGDCAAAESLIRAHPGLANCPNWTPPPIHCSVLWDQPAIAELLLRLGANIELLDRDRQTTPLRYAIMFCKPDLIRLLLANGANAGPIVLGGSTALELAQDAASGAYEEYQDLRSRQEYAMIAKLLRQLGC